MAPSPDSASLSGPFGRQDPSLPQVFGRYLLVQRLSRGGMGEIFLAKHGLAGFEKLAVIKKVLPHLAADASFIARFVDEAQLAIKLSHVNVAQVFEVGRVGDEYFLALEFIDGRDLRRILARLGHTRDRLPIDLALFISREVANGLAYAHRRTTPDGQPLNLVHCDISPPNILVSFEGETKVIDFGIAKSVMRAAATDPKLGFGKFGYMAPEQLIRGGVVDHRTDIYAAGVVLYEALTGTRLYEAGPEPNYRELARKVARGDHPLPSEIEGDLAPYDDLVATALRPKAEDRYQSAAELRDAIQQCLVAVNPTISTDRLGSYMRELFTDEMSAQRELHERAASAHLADFEVQLHTQTISTVSFAQAQLPLPAPDATGPMQRPAPGLPLRESTQLLARVASSPLSTVRRPTGPSVIVAPITGRHQVASRPHTRPSPALDTGALPTGPLERSEIGPMLPPRTSGSSTRLRAAEPTARIPRSRGKLYVASGGLVVVVPLAGWGVAVSSRPPAPPIAQVAAPPTRLTVEPIPVPEPRPTPAPAPAPAIPRPPAPPRPAPTPRHAQRVEPHRPVAPPPPPPSVVAFTREMLGQKFQAVHREYDDYKNKFGPRLEREWGELATYIQFMPASDDDAGRREAARRLDAFRARMHE